jgi:hypothetical protein
MSSDAHHSQPPISSASPPPTHAQTLEEPQLTGRTLIFETHGHIKQHITVTSSQAHKYFLSFHRIKKPDIKLLIGQEGGPLAAVSYIHSWSRVYHIGLGNDDVSMEWVDYKTKVWPKEPTFEWKGATYILGRVSEDENGNKLEKPKLRCYFGVRDGAGRRVALYSPCKRDGKRTAVLKLANGMSEELEQVIILGIVSWREEMRRAG